MTDAPERIWVADCNSDWSSDSGVWGASWENDWDVEYVRADITNDMLEALELALDLADNDLVDFGKYGLTCDSDISKTYRAAITKAKGQNT